MTMNARERAALEAALDSAALNRALRWSPENEIAPDVPVPERSGDVAKGYTINRHTRDVWTAETRIGTHRTTRSPAFENEGRYGCWSQGGVPLYSTRELALRALRCAMEQEFAQRLREVDRQIAEAQAAGAAPVDTP